MWDSIFNWFVRGLKLLLAISACLGLLVRSDVTAENITDQTRVYTRAEEFDYVGWTLNALWVKRGESLLNGSNYLSAKAQHDLVISQIQLLQKIQDLEGQINQIYADPKVPDPGSVTLLNRQQLTDLKHQWDAREGLVEEILQQQVGQVLATLKLTDAGQPVPPVLYHTTPLPYALIVSPRNVIRADVDISLVAGLSVDERVKIENQVEQNLDVSALVVPIGGVGVYPTMVMSSTDLNWLVETISHEWTHNFLTLRPLGFNYFISNDLRTMNETTANLSGKEIGSAVIARFYPELVPPPVSPNPPPTTPSQPPAFDFRAEMHTTRVKTDALLAAGKISEAEAYMEARRQVFWDHGYQIRKLNQAYFAFYGAYADVPGGEAGQDPVGPAVVALRDASSSLADFLHTIGQMTSFEQLQQAVAGLKK